MPDGNPSEWPAAKPLAMQPEVDAASPHANVSAPSGRLNRTEPIPPADRRVCMRRRGRLASSRFTDRDVRAP